MTTQESIDDILARLKHALLQRERAAREWERQSNQWEQRWRDVTKERDELLLLVGAVTPIAALTLAQSWQAEKAHMMDAYKEAVEALDFLYGAVLNDMTARDLPHQWAPDSAMGRASTLLSEQARVSSHNVNQATSAVEETQWGIERRAICELLSKDNSTIAGQTLLEGVQSILGSRESLYVTYGHLIDLASKLIASMHGDGDGRCWCGAHEADQLRAYLERGTKPLRVSSTEPPSSLAAAARAVLDTQLAYTAATVLVSRDAFEALRRVVGDGA